MRRRLLLCSALWLGGCASGLKRTDDAPFWSGRLALQVHTDPPEQFQASFELKGSAQAGELQLLSPLGTLLARLAWDAQHAMLEQGSQRQSAANVQELLQQVTHTSVPLEALFDWLGGQATSQAGWHADLSGHPQGRILAQRQEPAPAAVLRIVLNP